MNEETLNNIDQMQQPDRSLRSKLNKTFMRFDYVGVRNPLKTKFMWVVALEQNEILGVSQPDQVSEESMAKQGRGSFLPGDSVVKGQRRVVKYVLEPGETKMLVGEAAYVIVDKLFRAAVREKYGTDKAALARFRNPATQDELMKQIVVGPIINNVADAIQTFVNDKMTSLDGFTDVRTQPVQTPPVAPQPTPAPAPAPEESGQMPIQPVAPVIPPTPPQEAPANNAAKGAANPLVAAAKAKDDNEAGTATPAE